MDHLKNTTRAAGAALLATLVFACGTDTAVIVPAATGTRVIYIAADKAFAADTANSNATVTKISRHVDTTIEALSDPIMSLDGRFLGARVGRTAGCQARYEFVDTTDGSPMNTPRSNDECAHHLEFNPGGTNLALRVTFVGTPAARLVLADTPVADTMVSIDSGSTGNARQFHFSGDGSTMVWTENGGLFSSETVTVGSLFDQRSTDVPTTFAVTADGAYAVYVAPGETRFRRTVTAPGQADNETYLTAALGLGDTLGDYALSPDGTRLLYVAVIGGAPQLWMVPIALPLTELRVDTAPFPTAGPSLPKFAWNTDGTRFAWFGDAGGNDIRVHFATTAAPLVAVALTPAGQVPFDLVGWSDATTVVYDTYDIGFGLSTLRTVAVGAPLTTVPLSPLLTLAPGVDAFTICGDGTIVYRFRGDPGTPSGADALYSAQAMDANSVQRFTPQYPAIAGDLGEFVCAQ